MDILTDVLDRFRLKGTVLFHYEFGRPWSVALPPVWFYADEIIE